MSGDVPPGPPTVVKVGSGGYLEWTGEDVTHMSASRLLKALKHDELFETKLATVALDDCKVFVLPDTGTEHFQLGREGDEFATVAEVRARAASTAPIIRIRVELPAPAAAGGAGAGNDTPTVAELKKTVEQQGIQLAQLLAQTGAVDPELLSVLQKGMFTVLDKDGLPNCCGFFVRKSGVALTVRHGHERWLCDGVVQAVMLTDECGVSSVSSSADVLPGETPLEFKVHSFSSESELDFTCLLLTSAVVPGTFQPLPLPPAAVPNKALVGASATLLHGSIALNRLFSVQPSASLVPCSIVTAHQTRVLYTAATAGGDSGGALVLHNNQLIAMHIEGINDVPDELELLSPPAVGTKRMRTLHLSEASPTTSGAALRLDLPAVRAAVDAAHAAAVAEAS